MNQNGFNIKMYSNNAVISGNMKLSFNWSSRAPLRKSIIAMINATKMAIVPTKKYPTIEPAAKFARHPSRLRSLYAILWNFLPTIPAARSARSPIAIAAQTMAS